VDRVATGRRELLHLIQAWDFGAGSNFALEMHKAALDTEHTVAVLSPDFLRSEFCAPEWTAAFAGDASTTRRKLLPVVVASVNHWGCWRPIPLSA
jgi:hypothetical protein